MLPLKPFSIIEPANIPSLYAQLSGIDECRSKFLAGGTDLLPNLKHGLYDIDQIVSLRRLDELRFVEVNDHHISLGALVTINSVANNKAIQQLVPALAKASAHIASPQIRNMGTVGGNICLDTRCLYFNQTEFWRSALGYCLKKDGCACHVVKTGKRCVAAASNDLATVLLALDAKILVHSRFGCDLMNLNDFYTANGEKNNVLPAGSLVANVSATISSLQKSGFYKVRMRESIDFPMLSVAVNFHLRENVFSAGRLVVNALVAKPKVLDLDEFANTRYNLDLIHGIADFVSKKCHPQTNIMGDVGFRKHMVNVAVMRAFHDANVPV